MQLTFLYPVLLFQPVKQIMVATSQPAEERAHGSIGMKTYYKYFTVHRGHLLTLLVMVVFIMGEVCDVLIVFN